MSDTKEIKPAGGTAKTQLVEVYDQFAAHPTKVRKFSSGLVKFSFLYDIHKLRSRFFAAALFGGLLGIFTALFIENTGLYTGGTGAFFQGIARVVRIDLEKNTNMDKNNVSLIYECLFWGLYLLMNIPLTIFAYRKIGKVFAMLSLTFLACNQGLGFLTSYILEANNINVYLFGPAETIDPNLQHFEVKLILFDPQYFPTPNNDASSYDWNNMKNYADTINSSFGESTVNYIYTANLTRGLSLFVYAVVFALFSGTLNALIFMVGGTTAGSDFIAMYWSEAKNKSVGMVFTIWNSCFMIMGVALGSFLGSVLVDSKHYLNFSSFFSANFLCSILSIFLIGKIIDKLFPWTKTVEVHIYSQDTYKIADVLTKMNYTHDIFSTDTYLCNKDTTNKMFRTTCMCIELPKLISVIRKYDKKCIITTDVINDIDGEMTVQKRTPR